jgi:hypothetical protein
MEQVIAGGIGAVVERMADLASLGVDDVVIRAMATDQRSALATIEAVGEVRSQLN